MSLELVAYDGCSKVLPLFASTNQIRVQTIKIKLGSTMVELSTTHQANSSTSLDVLLEQQQDLVPALPSSRDATAATSLPQDIAPFPQPQPQGIKENQEKKHGKSTKQHRQQEEMRGWLLMVATVFAAMTYQAGLSPPSGQHDDGSSSLPSGNITGIINIMTPSLINTTILCNTTSSDMASPSKESNKCNMFVTANTIAFVYSMSAIVLLLSNTLCNMLDGRTDLKAVMAINAFIIALAYSVGCDETSDSISLGPLIAMCLIVAAYFGDYVFRRIYKRESIIGKLCRKDYVIGKCLKEIPSMERKS